MGVENLPKKGHQPFYNVLVEDGSTRYAAQGKTVVGFRKLPDRENVSFKLCYRDVSQAYGGICGKLFPLIFVSRIAC